MEKIIKYFRYLSTFAALVALSYGLNFVIQEFQYKLNPRLSISCKEEVLLYCPKIEAGVGKVGKCLLNNFGSLTESCQKRLFSYKLGQFSHHPGGYLQFLLKSFVIFAAVFFVMFLFGERTNYRGFKTDFSFFVVNLLFARLISIFIMLIIIQLMIAVFPISFFVAAESASAWLPQNAFVRLLIYLLAVDFLGYLSHRAFHTKYLWKYHSIHHSSTNVQWHSNFRNHPVNAIFQAVIITIPLALFQLNQLTFVYFLAYMVLFDAYAHSGIRHDFSSKWTKPFKFLKYIIVLPQFHRYHHEQKPVGEKHQNYAGIFSLWDIIFGTGHFPSGNENEFGVKRNYPEDFRSLMFVPFKKVKND